ncbi:ABC1 kinase family protein [Rossellomorea sp. BNER]|uniref:ABC1 kinase family protein n=1 Tax=Rossellomorea sp. BNER TaxID=2962031 RepID=UPI003AF26274|nr:AarF/UbiB family protein [Rossellomorea sp. BNER]
MKKERRLWRMWKVLSLALSVVVRVYWYRILRKPESEKELLWERIGREFRETLFELEGVLIKIGQLLSIRADLLPRGFISQIQDLVDQVPASPWEETKRTLENEWNGPIEEKLSSINPQVVASASIGEVYKGQLMDGTLVAIKVQRPSIQSLVKTDFKTLAIIIWFARYFAPVPKGFIDFKKLYQELKQVIERELDFKKEMETAISFKERFSTMDQVKVPEMFTTLCTDKVLVMEWMDGIRINDIEKINGLQLDRNEISERLVRIFLPQWLEAGIFHADPHSGNVLVKPDGTIILLDFGMVGEISKNDATHFQSLLEAILLKNYSKAVEALASLGFLLPAADHKIIEDLLKEAMSFDIEKLKEMDLLAAKKQMNDLVKSLPIQVPTRFIFLGRSFATIEGLIMTISPEKDMLEIVKPAFMDWLSTSNTNKWRLLLNWLNSQPIFQAVHTLKELVQSPQHLLEQKERHQQNSFYFTLYENQKRQLFYLGLVGLAGVFAGMYVEKDLLWQGGFGLTAVSLTGYLVSSWKQRKRMGR